MDNSTEQPEEVYYEEADTRPEIINECYTALAALELIDASMMSKKAEQQVRSIRRMALNLLYYYMKELHSEVFEDEGED